MILVFLGPPGSGKGTQAKVLSEKRKLPHISLGDILRHEVRQESEIGLRAKEFINAGKLVPDELTIELTKKRISQADCSHGFILDGFPRSAAQAEALDKMFVDMGLTLDSVIYFAVNEDAVVERLTGRRSCKKCGAVYHIKFKLPKADDVCDVCGGELYQRKDDQEDAIRTRFEVYAQQTKPLIERYQAAGKLAQIDANGAIDEVLNRLLSVIGHGKD
ncbi:MAG: adenylate kinase [Candidatus Margulisbacteria bacterium]|nr:adenylate kinase [Candidatus Margulisiibacteriota bacterium]